MLKWTFYLIWFKHSSLWQTPCKYMRHDFTEKRASLMIKIIDIKITFTERCKLEGNTGNDTVCLPTMMDCLGWMNKWMNEGLQWKAKYWDRGGSAGKRLLEKASESVQAREEGAEGGCHWPAAAISQETVSSLCQPIQDPFGTTWAAGAETMRRGWKKNVLLIFHMSRLLMASLVLTWHKDHNYLFNYLMFTWCKHTFTKYYT